MGERTATYYKCDVCGTEHEKQEKVSNKVMKITLPVWFLTEQNEGYEVEPYIEQETLYICKECLDRAIKIEGYGAQGYNTYRLREDK